MSVMDLLGGPRYGFITVPRLQGRISHLLLFSTEQQTPMNNVWELIQGGRALTNNTEGEAGDQHHKAALTKCRVGGEDGGRGTWSPDTWGNWQLLLHLPFPNICCTLPNTLFTAWCDRVTRKCVCVCGGGTSPKVSSIYSAVRLAGTVRIRFPPLIIDPSGIVFSIVSIMMALVLLSTLASMHA